MSNLQCYKKCIVSFSRYVNVIFGKSDSGKSAFIRALRLALQNKSSRKIKRNNTEKCTVSIHGKDTVVTRTKSDDSNEYSVNNKKFKAFKTEIPKEITDITKITDVNFQIQKDHFFLLNESPGKVCKILNDVAGLSITHASIKEVNSRIGDLKSEIRIKNNDLLNTNSEIDSLLWVESVYRLKTNLDSITPEYTILQNKISKLESLKRKYDSAVSCINDIGDLELQKSLCSELRESIRNYNILLKDIEKIRNIRKQYDTVKKYVQTIKTIEINEILVLITEYDKLKKQYDKIAKAVKNLKETMARLDAIENKNKSIQKDLLRFKKCPTCSSIIGISK